MNKGEGSNGSDAPACFSESYICATGLVSPVSRSLVVVFVVVVSLREDVRRTSSKGPGKQAKLPETHACD